MTDIDYRGFAKNLTFPVNSVNGTMQCVNVTTNDDTLVESDETFTIALTLITTGLGVSLSNETTTVSIVDNEG